MTCPLCEAANLRWSKVRFWEQPLRILGIRPDRCRSCRYRGYLVRWSANHVARLSARVTAQSIRKLMSSVAARARV